ncbi:MAG: diacylglycerol kinase family protein [Patescibacteria group bacterium]
MKKALVIFNPSAGVNVKYDMRGLIENKLRSLGYESEVFLLDNNFERTLSDYDFSAISLLVAVGGDGTVKVAARTIVTRKLSVPLAIIPFGSANVAATTLKIPLNPKEALKLLDRLKTTEMDLGVINKNNYFVVGFSIGYVSDIIINTGKDLKNRWGRLSYLWRLAFNKLRIPRIKFKIQTSSRTFWIKGNSLIIFNAYNLYGFQPKKSISVSDGILNLYVVTNKTFWSLIRAGLYVLFYHEPPRHIFSLDNGSFRISLKRRGFLKTCQIDGDHLILPKEMMIEVLPQALDVVIK